MTATTLDGVLLKGVAGSRPAANAVAKGTLYSATDTGAITQSDGVSTWSAYATITGASGSITASGYTQTTARLLGRTTASTGAIEEITVGSGLSLSGGSLTATGGTSPVGAQTKVTAGDYSGLASTSFTDLDATNVKLTLTTGNHFCLVGFIANGASGGSGAEFMALDLDIDGTREGNATDGMVITGKDPASANNLSFTHMTNAALSAGSHTFKIKYRVSASTGTIYASTTVSPLFFWVAELGF